MGQSGTGLKFSFTADLKIFKALFEQSFKKCVKNNCFGPK